MIWLIKIRKFVSFVIRTYMKNHSSRRAGKGKVGYRTPSLFRANKSEKIKRDISQSKFSPRLSSGLSPWANR